MKIYTLQNFFSPVNPNPCYFFFLAPPFFAGAFFFALLLVAFFLAAINTSLNKLR